MGEIFLVIFIVSTDHIPAVKNPTLLFLIPFACFLPTSSLIKIVKALFSNAY